MTDGTQAGSIPVIDFEKHPGFRHLDVERSSNDARVQELVEEIERECAAISPDAGWSNDRLALEFRDKIQPKFEEIKNLAVASRRMDAWFRDYTVQAIQRGSGFLLEHLQSRSSASTRFETSLEKSADACFQAIVRDGFCSVDLDSSLAQKIWRSTWWERSVLRRRAESGPGRHCALALNDYSLGSLLIQRALGENGVLSAVSAYIGQKMAFMYAALDYSHEKQNWYKGCYLDVGVATSRTAYMHFDADSDVMKAMLYLKDVRPESGPFRYVRGSHRWRRSAVQCALDKAFDAQQTKIFEMENDGLDYKLGYYRPRYKLPECRSELMMLPRALRGSTHFGDDVVDGSLLSDSLLRQEEAFVGPAGTLIVFDGSKGIHRGSQVDQGERWAVQIGMRVARGGVSGRLPPPARALVGRLRYQLHRTKDVLRTALAT